MRRTSFRWAYWFSKLLSCYSVVFLEHLGKWFSVFTFRVHWGLLFVFVIFSDIGWSLSSSEWSVTKTSLWCSWEIGNFNASFIFESFNHVAFWQFLIIFSVNSFQRFNYRSCSNICHAFWKWAFWGIHWPACHGINGFHGCFHRRRRRFWY